MVKLTRPLPPVLIFHCPEAREKHRYLAAFYQEARGAITSPFYDPCFEEVDPRPLTFLVSRVFDQWTGATAEEAKAKAVAWWTYNMDEARIVTKKGAAAAGTEWLVNNTTKHRVRVKADEVQDYLDQGYIRGKQFS